MNTAMKQAQARVVQQQQKQELIAMGEMLEAVLKKMTFVEECEHGEIVIDGSNEVIVLGLAENPPAKEIMDMINRALARVAEARKEQATILCPALKETQP